MRLISWNVAGRLGKLDQQIDYLRDLNPDILALQECTDKTIPKWKDGIADRLGLPNFLDSRSLVKNKAELTGPRRYGVMLASRFPMLQRHPTEFLIPWPERVLTADIDTPSGIIEAHTAYVPPGSSNGLIKIEVLEGIHFRLAQFHTGHRFLCGDFNMPRRELPDGTIYYWGSEHRKDGTLKMKKGRTPRWIVGERSVREGLAAYDLEEQFWKLNHPQERVDTWIPTQGRNVNPRRFDHLYASSSLECSRCWYDHNARETGLSDHSILLADMNPRA